MVERSLCRLLGIERPVVLAPMGGAVGPALAAAVSNAGGLGMLPLSRSDDVSGVVRQTCALTRGPVGANLCLEWDQHARLESVLEEGLRNPTPVLGRSRSVRRPDP